MTIPCTRTVRLRRSGPIVTVTAGLAAVTRAINLPIDEALAAEASWFAYAASTGDAIANVHPFLASIAAGHSGYLPATIE